MGLIPETSFTVRTPAWWDDASEYVLAEYPGREEAMRLAGHDWDVLELDSFTGKPDTENATYEQMIAQGFSRVGNGWIRKDEGWKSHVRSDTGALLHKPKDSYERIQNSTAYDVAEILFDEGFCYETAGSMDGGKLNYITLLLNEPIVIARVGVESLALPFGCFSWAHDGTASLKVRSGTIVQVCQNTVTASEAEGKRLGTDFTFRHTKNVMERIEDAKAAVRGVREGVHVYVKLMDELAAMPVTPNERELFVSTIIGDKGDVLANSAATTQRVKNNLEKERTKILSLFMGATIPESQRLTGYGLFQAGTEYFDHLRRYQTAESYTKRTLLADNPAKASLVRTIRETIAA